MSECKSKTITVEQFPDFGEPYTHFEQLDKLTKWKRSRSLCSGGSQRRNADMREIIFRGRHKGGDWLYGDFFRQYEPHDPQIYAKQPGYGGYFDVDRETVGQFTGMCDKNGKQIYEGDILKLAACGPDSFPLYVTAEDMVTGNYMIDETPYVVEWFPERAAFLLFDSSGPQKYLNNVNLYAEIVGNIHDNPELMEG